MDSKDIWGSVKSIVSKTLPILGNAIVPGIGGIAGSLIAEVLGVDPNDPKQIETELKNANPEVWAKLKESTMKHEERLIELGMENDKMYIADVQNARNREVEITKATGKFNTPLYILAGLIVFGFFSTLGITMFVDLSASNLQISSLLLGTLATSFGMIIQYFYGSSKGSTEKNAVLQNSIPKDFLDKFNIQK